MSLFTFMLLIVSFSAYANYGKILQFSGKQDSYVLRNNNKIKIDTNLLLEKGDQIFTNDSQVLVTVYPSTQIVLDKNSHLGLSSELEFTKGKMKTRIGAGSKEESSHKVQANQVAFTTSSGEFEVSYGPKKFIELFVANGEVEASSPQVQTFVPEIIKTKEGFRFNIQEPGFSKQRYAPKFKTSLTFKKVL